MKKLLSAAAAAVLGAASIGTAASIPAVVSADSEGSILVLGDSIASGYNSYETVEYNYGEICADYLGYDAYNFAVPGATSTDLYEKVSNDNDVRSAAADSDVIVISIGGNDMIQVASEFTADFLDTKGMLNAGYTSADIKAALEKYGVSTALLAELKKMADLSKLTMTNATKFTTDIKTALTGQNTVAGGCVNDTVMPNLKNTIRELHAINPDAEIVVQTVYQPLQMSQEFWNNKFEGNGEYAEYNMYVEQIRTMVMEKVMSGFADYVYMCQRDMAADEGIDIAVADVYAEFTSLELSEGRAHWRANNANVPNTAIYYSTISKSNQGYTHYFTDTLSNDFHPNQKGHLAIAAVILEQLGNLHDTNSSSLMRSIYENLKDKASYPAIALGTYNNVVGKLIGDDTEPTTTTTTTTSKVTTTTTTTPKVTTTTTTTSKVATTTTTTAKAPELNYNLGDVDNDGHADASDASRVLAEYALKATGHAPTFNAEQNKAADVNKDGKQDASDASLILSYYAYKSTGGDKTIEEFVKR